MVSLLKVWRRGTPATHADYPVHRAYNDMFYLINKYAPFEKGQEPPRIEDASRAALSAERDHTRG